jgi:hypothetical protein
MIVVVPAIPDSIRKKPGCIDISLSGEARIISDFSAVIYMSEVLSEVYDD